jgi:hypothetical protein
MGKTNPRRKLWVEAVRNYIAMLLSANGFNTVQKANVEVLDFFAVNARDRNKVWYEGFRDYVVGQMLRQGISERKTEYGTTHYMLVPNLTMGKDEDGMRRFQNLIDAIGLEEAEKLVSITLRLYPVYELLRLIRDPLHHDGEEQQRIETVEEAVETEYTFVGKGDTKQLLAWTVAMGNKPSFEVGPATKRVKEDKERRQR